MGIYFNQATLSPELQLLQKGQPGARRHYEADVTTVHQVLGSEPQAAR